MFNLSSHRALATLLAAVILLLVASSALAQVNTPTEVEIVGAIQTLTDTSLTVNDLIADITGAEINTTLEINAIVYVEGTLLADGIIQAREVGAAEDGLLPGELEIIGTLDDAAAGFVVVSGLTFDTTGARIETGLALGDMVKVHASLAEDGTWVAREVQAYVPETSGDANSGAASPDVQATEEPSDMSGAFEITGTLEEVGDGFIVVSGQTIDVRNAEISGQLLVGAMVKVELRLVEGVLVAHEIKGARPYFEAHHGEDDGQGDDSAGGTSAVVVPDNCVATQPAGWTTYTIQSGDTLSGLAARTGSTAQDLAATNCITDPRLIMVGAELYVPRTPDATSFGNDNQNDNEDDHSNDNHQEDNRNDNEDDHSNDNGVEDNHNDNS